MLVTPGGERLKNFQVIHLQSVLIVSKLDHP